MIHYLPLILTSLTAFADTSDWREISRDEGITIYLKPATESGTISVRGDATLNANAKHILDILADNKQASEWMPLVKERRDLKQLSETSRIEYTHIDLPWPVSDRYFINEATALNLPNGGYHISVKSIENPPSEWLETGKVLGFLHFSELYLTPKEGGIKTFVSIEVNTDPRGLIPKWIINYEQRSWPKKFFLGLKRQLEKNGFLKTNAAEATAPALTH